MRSVESKAEELYTYLAQGNDEATMPDLFLTFCPFPERVPGFSMSELFLNPRRYPDEWDLVRSKQIEMRQVLFSKERFDRIDRVLDIGCGHGTDIIQLATLHSHLQAHGFTIARAQAELGNRRIREKHLRPRAQIFHKDSSKDPFPATYDLMIGIEVSCHIRNKEGLFANMAAALADGGRILVVDFVANLQGAIADPSIDVYISTRDQWVEVLSRHHLLLDEVIDVSPQVANYLYDPDYEEHIAGLPEVLRGSLQSYANSALSIERGWLGYYLLKLSIDRQRDESECLAVNAARLSQPTPYLDALRAMTERASIPYRSPADEVRHRDREEIEAPAWSRSGSGARDVEAALVALTARVLGFEERELEELGTFRAMGISSVSAVELVQEINNAYHLRLPSNVIFECPTPRALAQLIAGQRAVGSAPCDRMPSRVSGQAARDRSPRPDRYPELVHLNEVVEGRPVFWLHGGHGGVDNYRELAQQLDRPFYGIQARGFMTDRTPLRGIQAMAAYYVTVIHSVQGAGPFDLGGYSLGGTLAYEVTRQLQEVGHEVPSLVMLDALDTAGSVAQRFSKKSELLQIVNGELHALRQPVSDAPAAFIHRDEVDAALDEEAYLDRLIVLAKARGLKRSKDDIEDRFHRLTEMHEAFELDRFAVLPLRSPDQVSCYYFRNRSGLFFGDMEPYFTTSEDAAALDHVDYWSEWRRELPHFLVSDVAASNHMVLLSEPGSRDAIVGFCRALYSRHGPSAEALESFRNLTTRQS